jgi:hypothetical protein
MKGEEGLVHTITYQHIYLNNGFSISKAIFGGKKDFKPKKTHACIQFGKWCDMQIREEGEKAIILYLRKHKIRNFRKIINAIKKIK